MRLNNLLEQADTPLRPSYERCFKRRTVSVRLCQIIYAHPSLGCRTNIDFCQYAQLIFGSDDYHDVVQAPIPQPAAHYARRQDSYKAKLYAAVLAEMEIHQSYPTQTGPRYPETV